MGIILKWIFKTNLIIFINTTCPTKHSENGKCKLKPAYVPVTMTLILYANSCQIVLSPACTTTNSSASSSFGCGAGIYKLLPTTTINYPTPIPTNSYSNQLLLQPTPTLTNSYSNQLLLQPTPTPTNSCSDHFLLQPTQTPTNSYSNKLLGRIAIQRSQSAV